MNRNVFDLSKKKVAIIGCGGLGCNISIHLSGAGVGKIILCDFDLISESNLNRQFLYTEKDIGKTKVELAKERLSAYNSQIKIEAINKKILSVEDLFFADKCDLIFLAVDNNETRKIVSEYCFSKNKPLVNGGVNSFFGTAYLYIPGKTPCLECTGILSTNTKKIVSVSSTVGIIGALEAELGIKYLLDSETDCCGKLFVHDNSETTTLVIKSNPDCKICNQKMR